jgi:hypothetical protein
LSKAFELQLEDPLRAIDVLQPVLAEVTNRHARRKVVLDQLAGRVGEQHLAAMTRGANAGGPVDTEPQVAVTGCDRLAGVQPDANAHLPVLGPFVRGKCPLGRVRRGDRVQRAMESEEERVTL